MRRFRIFCFAIVLIAMAIVVPALRQILRPDAGDVGFAAVTFVGLLILIVPAAAAMALTPDKDLLGIWQDIKDGFRRDIDDE